VVHILGDLFRWESGFGPKQRCSIHRGEYQFLTLLTPGDEPA
jgi:hypothetical protein